MKYIKDNFRVLLDPDEEKNPELFEILAHYKYIISKKDSKQISKSKINDYAILNIDTIGHEVSIVQYADSQLVKRMSNVYPVEIAIKSLKIHKMMEYVNHANKHVIQLDEHFFELLYQVMDNDTIDKILNKVNSGFYQYEFLNLLQFAVFKQTNKQLQNTNVIVTEKADEKRLLEALDKRNFMKDPIYSYDYNDPIGIVYEIDEVNKIVTRKPATVVLEDSNCNLYSTRKYLEKTQRYELQNISEPLKVIRQVVTVCFNEFGYESDIFEYDADVLFSGDILIIDNEGYIKEIQHKSRQESFQDNLDTFQYILVDNQVQSLFKNNHLYKLEATDFEKNSALEYEHEETFEL